MKNIVVAMSGGVDSSVAAAILKEQGHRVTGVTMKIWGGPPSAEGPRHACYGPGEDVDVRDAASVAEALGIKLHVLDLSAEYKSGILDYCQAEYLSGRTPNPCSRCNPMIKFGALASRLTERGIDFDFFATGHYARVEYSDTRRRRVLRKARDLAKDQSYFLALLSLGQIERSLFPLGEYSKPQVRAMAVRFGLPVAEKPDSQDFVAGGYRSLVAPGNPGPILDRRGRKLGEHRGMANHTIGQRKGLGVAGARPLYVIELDPEANAVIVGDHSEACRDSCVASNLNWIAIDGLDGSMRAKARIRYHHREADSVLSPIGSNRVHVQFSEPQLAVTPGQTVVFYDGDVVLGGGTIDRNRE